MNNYSIGKSRVILLGLLLLVPGLTNAQPASAPQPKTTLTREAALQSLGSTNKTLRGSAVSELNELRISLASQLLGIVNGTNSDAAKVDAVILLGDYRISDAVPVLMKHFELDDVYPRMHGNSSRTPPIVFLESKPVVSDALVMIGLPAIPHLLDKIAESDETNVIEKCVRICCRIEGRGITQIKLQHLKDLATDQKMRGRIETALGLLLTYDPTWDIGLAGAPEVLPQVADELPTNFAVFDVQNCAERQGFVLTRLRLEDMLAKKPDATKKGRIQSALDILAKLKPSDN